MLSILFYDYVPGMAEKRQPYREGHLGILSELYEQGKLRMAGAYSDPLDGGALVFNERAAAESFVARDPYVANGLVTNWRIREWNVVLGA